MAMSERITSERAAALLNAADHILILTHQYPDGDTLGSGYALCRALTALGKTARVLCADEIPGKYGYMTEGVAEPDFEPAFICAVDVAGRKPNPTKTGSTCASTIMAPTYSMPVICCWMPPVPLRRS